MPSNDQRYHRTVAPIRRENGWRLYDYPLEANAPFHYVQYYVDHCSQGSVGYAKYDEGNRLYCYKCKAYMPPELEEVWSKIIIVLGGVHPLRDARAAAHGVPNGQK